MSYLENEKYYLRQQNKSIPALWVIWTWHIHYFWTLVGRVTCLTTDPAWQLALLHTKSIVSPYCPTFVVIPVISFCLSLAHSEEAVNLAHPSECQSCMCSVSLNHVCVGWMCMIVFTSLSVNMTRQLYRLNDTYTSHCTVCKACHAVHYNSASTAPCFQISHDAAILNTF